MARRWTHAEVTCTQPGKTHKKGFQFKSGKAKKIENLEIADRFRYHPWFSVLDFWYDDIEKFSTINKEPEREPVEELEQEPIEEPVEELEQEPVEEPVEKPAEEPKKKVVKKKVVKKKVLKKKVKKADEE